MAATRFGLGTAVAERLLQLLWDFIDNLRVLDQELFRAFNEMK